MQGGADSNRRPISIASFDQQRQRRWRTFAGDQVKLDRREFVVGTGATLAAAGTSWAADGSGERTTVAPATAPDKIGLRYAFSVAVFFNERIFIESPRTRGFVPAQGGEIWGPRLQGRVVPYGGADYASNGFIAHYALEAADGALIYIMNRGFVKRLDGKTLVMPRSTPKPGEAIDQRVRSASIPDEAAMSRVTPLFDAPIGPHDWLNRTLFVGHARRYVNPDHTIFTYHEVL